MVYIFCHCRNKRSFNRNMNICSNKITYEFQFGKDLCIHNSNIAGVSQLWVRSEFLIYGKQFSFQVTGKTTLIHFVRAFGRFECMSVECMYVWKHPNQMYCSYEMFSNYKLLTRGNIKQNAIPAMLGSAEQNPSNNIWSECL